MKSLKGARLNAIEILENDKNKKGDLFGRLMGDFFHAIGYDEPQHNTPKSGRELDFTVLHRTERKIAVAEVKAHKAEIGGDDINKFVGSLDAEKRKFKKIKELRNYGVTGYFIALTGFKSSTIEQELEANNERVILVGPDKIVNELIAGNIIVSPEKAIAATPQIPPNLELSDKLDLLAYEKGWIWAIYYKLNNIVTNFSLIHAEGKPLVKELAEEIISLDKKCNNILENLEYIQPNISQQDPLDKLEQAKNKYYKYLESECGEIHFEGLPTDKDAGSVKVNLENIFVPLHLEELSQVKEKTFESRVRENIGESLTKHNKLAILAKPGGGKSTLIKRLAIAYAFPQRRKLISDSLPDKNLFPIFIRCRELGEKVSSSITEIIDNIPTRAEISHCNSEFSAIASTALQKGEALILIDGLDEISDDRDRVSFVNQLRTFLATYPQINIVVTSREAGFRIVGGSLANYCAHYKLSNLNSKEIEELTIKWHKAIVDESENTVKEAKSLFKLIITDSRIRVLAENPLLLTTLLFVKRWAGYLPTKKSVLYQEMIKLLLVTWNVEGHEQLDIEEAEPQLAYVAFWMTTQGQQTITVDELKECLLAARKQMPDILKFTKVSIPNFIKRVESRSSLLIMSGHKKSETGETTPIYEFLHLSFQEYLTAKAIIEKYLPEQNAEESNLEIIKPYLYKENWKEITPLVAALAKRSTRELKELISFLIDESKKITSEPRRRDKALASDILGSCIANEIQINPDLLEQAIEWFAKNYFSISSKNTASLLLKSKFNDLFLSKIESCLIHKYEDKFIPRLGSLAGELYQIQRENISYPRLLNDIKKDFISGEKTRICFAGLALMEVAFERATSKLPKSKITILTSFRFEDITTVMPDLLSTDDKHYIFVVSWCLAWMEEAGLLNDTLRQKFVPLLIRHWVKKHEHNLSRMISWALSHMIRPSYTVDYSSYTDIVDIIKSKYRLSENEYDKITSVFIGTSIGYSFDIKEVRQVFAAQRRMSISSRIEKSNLGDYATVLGINLSKLKDDTPEEFA